MSIAIVSIDGLHCPLVICDYCGDIIDTVADGLYRYDDPSRSPSTPMFLHRSSTPEACDLKVDRNIGRLWMGLDFFISALAANLAQVDELA